MGFSPKYSTKYEAYNALKNKNFLLGEFRLILLDRITFDVASVANTAAKPRNWATFDPAAVGKKVGAAVC